MPGKFVTVALFTPRGTPLGTVPLKPGGRKVKLQMDAGVWVDCAPMMERVV